MGSLKQPKQVFSPEELRTLDLAFAGALATAMELGLPCAGLTGALRRRLFDVASTGITDPEALRDEAQGNEYPQDRQLAKSGSTSKPSTSRSGSTDNGFTTCSKFSR